LVSARWASRRLVTGLAALLLSPILSVLLTVPGARADQPMPVPAVQMSVDASPLIGETVGLDVSFWNDSTVTGYGPFVDLVMPMGADGYDGLTFDSATYLGQPVTSTVLTAASTADDKVCVTHPYAVDSTGAAVRMCDVAMGQPLAVGQEYVVLRLPFGSFTPGQPAATVHVTADLSEMADAGTPITIATDGGFQFGATPLADPATDPSIFGAAVGKDVTPTIMRITKTYIGPENETATGPNFPRSYRLEVTVAKNQPVTDLTITDTLPDTLQFLRISTDVPPSPGCAPGGSVSTTTPGGVVSCDFGAIIGSGHVDATLVFDFYVPRLDKSLAAILPADRGTFNTSIDNASASAHWTPVDPNDRGSGPITVNAGPATHTLTDKSIAIQKPTPQVIGGGLVAPGATLEWTLNVQVSDYFALDGVVVDDLLGDGTRVDPGFTPTLSVSGNGFTSGAIPIHSVNYTVSDVLGSGQTPIRFAVSSEMADRGGTGRMIGGCVDPAGGSSTPDCTVHNGGPVTATIVFRSVVQQTYVDGTTEVVEGDTLRNWASAYGNVLDTGTLAATHSPAYVIGDGDPYADDADAFTQHAGTSASITIQRGTLTKSIYAVNGHTTFQTPVHVSPGDTITYRLKQTFPTTRTDAFTITDYLPLPVFYATGAWPFDPPPDGGYPEGTTPEAGHFMYGPADTFHSLPGAPTPHATADGGSNSVLFDYGNYALYDPGPSTADLLFTVTVSTDPFADGLLLTNQARSETENSVHTVQTADAIVQITLDQPVLAITKGVVRTDNPAGVFAPVTTGPVAFDSVAAPPTVPCTQVDPGFDVSGGPLTTAALAGHPIDSNLSAVDGSDYVRFTVVVQDTGHASAFAVQIKDTIPDGFVKPAGGYDMCVTDGAGTSIGATNIGDSQPIGDGEGFFHQGIELVDPTVDGKPVGALAPGLSATGVANDAGTNLVVISYTLQVSPLVVPHTALVNVASLIDFKNSPTASSHLPPGSPLTDSATVTTASPSAVKILDGTDQTSTLGANVAIGEIATYKLTVTMPEGRLPGATVVDTLPTGLALVDCSPISASAGVSSSVVTFDAPCVAGTNPTVSSGGQVVTFDLGTVTNADTTNTTAETIVIEYRAVVLNAAGNTRGKTLHNSAVLSWTGDGIAAVSAADLTVVEPKLTIVKMASPTTGDAGDSILFTFTVTNPTATNGADAFDVSLTDLVPGGMSYDGITPFTQTGDPDDPANPHATIAVVDGTLTATWAEFDVGGSATFEFSATIGSAVTPGTVYQNTADLAWTSLPGDHHSSLTKLSTFSDVATERTGDGSDPGAPNNYADSDEASVTVPLVVVQKTIDGTNQGFTDGNSVAIGEIVTYRVEMKIPEGSTPNASLVDTLPVGMAFVRCTGISVSSTVSLSTDLSGDFAQACSNPTVGAGGRPVTFNLGNITNGDRNNEVDETIDITYEAVVLNVASNVSGTQLHNVAVLHWDVGKQSDPAAGPTLTVVEPDMAVDKTASPLTGDAGDVITFTVTITNPDKGNNTDTFDASWSDAIPDGMTYQGGTIGCSGTCPVFDVSNAKLLKGTWSEFDLTDTATITYQAKLDDTVQSGATFTNTATITWTSLSGDYHTAETKLSGFNDNSTERTGDKTDPGLDANDYEDDDSAVVTVLQPAPVKTLVSTSEAGTADTPTPYVAVGEVARLRVAVIIPEGQSQNVQITDTLQTGLSFLNDNTATVAFVTDDPDGGMTSSVGSISGAGLNVSGHETWLGDPTFEFPSAQISGGPFGDGASVTFNLGTLTNNDRDSNKEMVVIEYNVLVDNVPGNTRGHPLTDSVRIHINGTDPAAAGTLTIYVAEPNVTVTKALVNSGAIDGGDTIIYTIKVKNTSAAGASPAYDVDVTDTLDSHLTLVSAVPSPALGATYHTSGSTVHFTFDSVAPGTTTTLTITATLDSHVNSATVIPNTGAATWTSLPGPRGTTSNPTGSPTPDDSGKPTGERDGSGGTGSLNSYCATSSAPFTVAKPAISKLGPADATRPIGATTTFDLVVTLPEGTTRGFKVIDTLPDGLQVVDPSNYAIVTTVNGHAFSGSLSTPTITAPSGSDGSGAWTFDFGDTYLAPDGDVNNNSFILRVTVRVANVAVNLTNHQLPNQGAVGYNDPVSGAKTIIAAQHPYITVIEPALQVVKTVDNSSPRFGATLTYTLTLSHKAASSSDAFDVTMTDTLPAGLTLVPGSWAYVSGAHSVPDPVINGNTITFTYATLPLGTSSVYTYRATVAAAGSVPLNRTLTNAVDTRWTSLAGPDINERTGKTTDPGGSLNTYEATAHADATVSGVDLSLNKDDGVAKATAGAPLTYALNYTNSGNATAANVVITETVPVGTTYTGTGWTCAGGGGAGHTCTRTIGSVLGGHSGSVNFSVTVVDPIPPGLTSIDNTASVADVGGAYTDPTPDDNIATHSDSIDLVDLSLTKDVDDATPNANQVVVFTLTVSNDGPAQATGVKVTDTLPASLHFSSATPNAGGSYNSTTGLWTVGSVDAGGSRTLTLKATVTSRFAATNVAEVTHCDQRDKDSTPANGVTSEDDYATKTVTPKVADLGVTKSAAPSHPDVGSNVTYTITAHNYGSSNATGVKVTDVLLPGSLTYQPSLSSATTGSYDAGTHVWTIGALAKDASATLTLVATVDLAGEIDNTATIAGDQYDDNPSNNTATIATSQLVDLVVHKTVDNDVPNVGTTVEFTVLVTNGGPGTATGVTISDALPDGLEFDHASATQGNYDDSNGTWTVGSIAATTGSATLTVWAKVESPSPSTNTASVLHVDEPQSDTTNDHDSVTVTPPQADLEISKTVNEPRPSVTDDDFFTITVTNHGPDTATNVAVTDPLPDGLVYASTGSSATQGTFDGAAGTWTVGTLASGASATLTLHVTVTVDSQDYTNTATVTADQYDPNPNNNKDSASLSTRVVDIAVVKVADNPTPNVGTQVTFTVTVSNGGPDGATQLVIRDVLPTKLSFVSALPSVGSYDSTTGDWTIGDLADGASVILAITAQVDDSGTIDNTAAVQALLQLDSNHDNDHDTAEIKVPPAADLSLTKTVNDPTPDKGSQVSFGVTIVNNGPDAASGVHVGDLLPAGLTYVSSAPGVGTYDPITGDWNIGDMANGDVETLTVTVTVDVQDPITNTAQVTASLEYDPDSTPNNNDPTEDDQSSAEINPHGVADLSLTKTASPAVLHKGDRTTYTIVVTNNGPDPAAGVIVRDQLPAGISYVSCSGPYDPTTGAWTVGNLAVGRSATLTITAIVGQAGSITNVADVVASDQRDPDPGNGEATAVVAAGGATPPPTMTAETGLPAGDPGSLALWVLGTALAGFALMSIGGRATRGRRFKLRR
jgi:uncharacterized repeat protein (TIGR01451 family)/fimbrial isopeptide formation D2 family protein